MFTTIDTHTGGNPTRTVTTGLPKLIGKTMSEKMLHMKGEYDWIRQLLMNEPRGHDVMSGALLIDPCHPEADIGLIFIETGGYLPMCGHDTIGACTALIESGMLPAIEPITRLNIDTPAGLVKTEIEVETGKVKRVTFRNIESFLYKSVVVNVPSIGEVSCDIAYGGNFYGIIDARSINLELVPNQATTIVDAAIAIRRTINEQHEVIHPQFPFIKGLTHIEFYTDPVHPEADVKNTVVVPPGGIDRSPCGTGTSAKLATLFSQGKLMLGEEFVHESIVGTLFHGRVLEETKVGDLPAVVTQISGSAWLMGFHTFFYDDEDELGNGFLLIPPLEVH
jgi:proline racemase